MDNVIVVASGKGGTGKSTVCICLSVALVKQGKKVLIYVHLEHSLLCLFSHVITYITNVITNKTCIWFVQL